MEQRICTPKSSLNDMETKILREVKRIFGYTNTNNEDLIIEAKKTGFDFENLIADFKSELNLNLAQTVNTENVIKYYLNELKDMYSIFNKYGIVKIGNKKPTDRDKYLWSAQHGLRDVFVSLDVNALHYGINFYSILEQTGFIELYKNIIPAGLWQIPEYNSTDKKETIEENEKDHTKFSNPQKLYLLIPEYNSTDKEEKIKENEEDHTKFSTLQKLHLLNEIGFLDLPCFKGNVAQTTKHKILAKLLGCHTRTAKGFLNGEEKYTPKSDAIEKVNKFITDNKLK
jgi:hypothetical protein